MNNAFNPLFIYTCIRESAALPLQMPTPLQTTLAADCELDRESSAEESRHHKCDESRSKTTETTKKKHSTKAGGTAKTRMRVRV